MGSTADSLSGASQPQLCSSTSRPDDKSEQTTSKHHLLNLTRVRSRHRHREPAIRGSTKQQGRVRHHIVEDPHTGTSIPRRTHFPPRWRPPMEHTIPNTKPRQRLDRRLTRLILQTSTSKPTYLTRLPTNQHPNTRSNNALRQRIVHPLPRSQRNGMACLHSTEKQLHRALATKSLDARTPRGASPIHLNIQARHSNRSRSPLGRDEHTLAPKLPVLELHRRPRRSRLEHHNLSPGNAIRTQGYIHLDYY